jgi:hypothetical protein
MAAITRNANVVKVDLNTAIKATQLAGEPLFADLDIEAGEPCTLSIIGTVVIATAVNIAAGRVIGFPARDYAQGEPMTLFTEMRIRWNLGALTPGLPVLLTDTGSYDDATGGTATITCGIVLSPTDLLLKANLSGG